MSKRQRYFVFVSVAYILLGVVIVARGIAAHAVFAAVFGLVFVALGAVRLRDFTAWRQRVP